MVGAKTISQIKTRVEAALKLVGQGKQLIEFNDRLWCCTEFDEVLQLSKNYVNVIYDKPQELKKV